MRLTVRVRKRPARRLEPRYTASMEPIYYNVIDSPIGALTLGWSDGALIDVSFGDSSRRLRGRGWLQDPTRLERATLQLREYFAGGRSQFDLPLRFPGTPFQERVWSALQDLPFGSTTSYGELAARIGEPKWPGAHDVGTAVGQNPIAIVLPCHRVIGSDGSLVGFGGGLPRKRWLLDHEAARPAAVSGGQTRLPGF